VYELSGGIRSTSDEDGGIVLDIERGQMFRLNPVGSFILELLRKAASETIIAREIARQYDISEASALGDVREFLTSLEKHQLVHTRNGMKTT
jgi:hypothetical protein